MTVIVIAVNLLVYLVGRHHGGLLPLLLDIVFLGLLGPSVEDAFGRARFGAFCLLASLLALAGRALAGAGSPSPVLLSASGVTAAVLGGYLLRYPRARVLTLVAVPFFMTIVEVPAALLIGLWLLLQIYFGAAGLG